MKMSFQETVKYAVRQIKDDSRDFREAANGNYRCWHCGEFFSKTLFGEEYQCPAIADGFYSKAICPKCGKEILRYVPPKS